MKNFVRVALAATVSVCAFGSFAATPDLSTCDEWRPASTCNYSASSRPTSYPISYVVIHKVQGSAASAASWFQNCAAKVSAHFTFNNSTGYCYQSVREKDIGWHAGNSYYNARSIGIEHGGYVSSNDTATVCYDESAIETKSTIIYYSVTHSRSRIVGHSEVPGATHTDPGAYWNWTYYMSKCNPNPSTAANYVDDSPAVSANWSTGTSAADKYGADYKFRSTDAISDAAVWSINVPNSGSYDIHAWWPAGSNRSTTAPYILPDNTTVNKNQQANGGSWQLLGTKSLGAGTHDTKLSCWTTTGFVVVADAVKYYGPK